MRSARLRNARLFARWAGPWAAWALSGLLACGGSASESPWPIEPLDAESGPRGEALPGTEASDLVEETAEPVGAGGAGGGSARDLEPMGGGS